MKIKHFTSEATARERFVGVFFLLLPVFYVACAAVFAVTDAHSNIVWHGEEVRGWRLFVANFLLIPIVAALLAGVAAVEHCIFKRMKYAILWLVLAAVIACVIGSVNLPTYHRLAERGVSEKATIVELLPQIHNSVRYEYQVGGQTFQGRMQSRQPNPPTAQLGVGSSVVVCYDPEHPEVSVLGDPKLMVSDETVPVLLSALIAPTFIVFVLARKESERKMVGSKVV